MFFNEQIQTKGVFIMVKIIHDNVEAVERIVGEITLMGGKRPRVTAVIPAGTKQTIYTIHLEN